MNKAISSRYIGIKLNNNVSLAEGDVINVECCADATTVTGVSVYLSQASDATSIFNITKSSSTTDYLSTDKNTTLSYTVTANDKLKGQTTFYIGCITTDLPVYVSSVKITRTGHANAMPTVLSTKRDWTFGNFSAGNITSSVINDQLYYGATTDNYMTISETSSSYGSTNYTRCLKSIDKGTVATRSTSPSRACMFMVPAGAGIISIVADADQTSSSVYIQVGTTKTFKSLTTTPKEYTYSYNTAYDVP